MFDFFRIDDNKRPVKLTHHVCGYPYPLNKTKANTAPFIFARYLTYELPSVIGKTELLQGKQILVYFLRFLIMFGYFQQGIY